MDLDRLRYLVFGGGYDAGARYGAVVALLADTVTTLYLLFFSGMPFMEFNPLGALLRYGFLGQVLFIAVPLFNILVLLYLPGLLGNAFAVSNLFVHMFAAAINLSHLVHHPIESMIAPSPMQAYVFAVTFATGIGILVYIPRLVRRNRGYGG